MLKGKSKANRSQSASRSISTKDAKRKVPSLREAYVKACKKNEVHPNSGVVELLPAKAITVFHIEMLDLHRNYIGDRGVTALLPIIARMPTLRQLDLSENGLRNKAICMMCEAAVSHPGLTSINLSGNYISEGAAEAIEGLLEKNRRIFEVDIDDTKIDVEWRVRIKDLLLLNRQINGVSLSTDELQAIEA